jgi:hypothetical protein
MLGVANAIVELVDWITGWMLYFEHVASQFQPFCIYNSPRVLCLVLLRFCFVRATAGNKFNLKQL